MEIYELRIGNFVWHRNGYKKIIGIKNEEILLTDKSGREKNVYIHEIQPIPLSIDLLKDIKEFNNFPHLILNIFKIELGRKRILSITDCGTPNEIWFLSEEDNQEVKNLIVVRNYDYDGCSYLHQLQNLYFSLSKKELIIKTY